MGAFGEILQGSKFNTVAAVMPIFHLDEPVRKAQTAKELLVSLVSRDIEDASVEPAS